MNPFIETAPSGKQFVSKKVSLNRVMLAKLPLYGIDDAAEGKIAFDIFSTWAIINFIKANAPKYGIDISGYADTKLPVFLNEGLQSSSLKIKNFCRYVAIHFGNRLGLILLTLKTGLPQNRAARQEWNDEHWEYFKNLKTFILCGGLASGRLGLVFKEQIAYVFDSANVKPYDIVLFESGFLTGVLGAAALAKQPGSVNLVFDFGQTNIKRALIKKDAKDGSLIAKVYAYDSIPSINMWEVYDDAEVKHKEAVQLHAFLKKAICDTYREAEQTYPELSNEIIISIANYVADGVISPALSGYEKLRLLGENYAELLSEELSGNLHRIIKVKLIHDGTATGLYFKDYKNAMCVTLGTAFGSGFPEIKI
ncbi:MAG: hypothetical protein LBM65_05745 [Oscillospiraceae bacterium]|jgi:hypothetical protein|nr:hypothetical protein [Oscillospiraceae bacterium]